MRGGRHRGTARGGIAAAPSAPAPDEVLVVHIRRVLEASPFHGEGYRKVWAKLRVEGIRTSKERVRRLMREHHLPGPARAWARCMASKAHDGTITTETPDVMWGTDMTTTVTGGEGTAGVFVAVDRVYDRVHRSACGQARNPRRGLGAHPPGCPRTLRRDRSTVAARGLRLRHDHGSNYLADDFQQEVVLLRHRQLPEFPAGARRERRRGAFHPHI